MDTCKRLALRAVVAVLIGGILAGCVLPATPQPAAPAPEATTAPAAKTGGEPVTLTWLQWWVNEWGPENHAKLIADFEASHPNIKVKVVDVPWPDMPGKLQAAAAGGSETYDVFGIENEWIASMVKQGYIEDLDPLLSADSEFANSLTSVTPMKFLGETKALCLYLIPYQLAYNVDLFQQKGVQPPTNWNEFIDVMTQLRDKQANQYGIVMSLQDASVIATRYFPFRLAQLGGNWFDENGNVAFNSPEGVEALQWWVDFLNKDLVAPGSMGGDQAFALELVASGQVPSIIDGPFVWTKAKQISPDIKIAYAPAWKDKAGGYSWACSGIGLSAKSQHKEEAWEFIKYLYSDSVAVDMTKTVSLPWATKAAMASLGDSKDPILKYIPEFANQDPDHNVLYPILPNQDQLLDAFKLAFQEAITGKKDAKTALDEAAAVWEKELEGARTP